MEERGGERRFVFVILPSSQSSPRLFSLGEEEELDAALRLRSKHSRLFACDEGMPKGSTKRKLEKDSSGRLVTIKIN
jgi:hypothetical protein